MALVIHGDRNKFRKERDDLFWKGIPGGGSPRGVLGKFSNCDAMSGSPAERGHAPMKSVHLWERVGLPRDHLDRLCSSVWEQRTHLSITTVAAPWGSPPELSMFRDEFPGD